MHQVLYFLTYFLSQFWFGCRIFMFAPVVVWAIVILVLLNFFFTCCILVWVVDFLVLLGNLVRTSCTCCDFSILSNFWWLIF
jgi:hypothetical protein